MAMQVFALLKNVTFSGLETPKNQRLLAVNIAKISIWGGLSSGAVATASFIFSRFLFQEGSWKTCASHIFKASLTSCVTFAAVVVYGLYKIKTQKNNQDIKDIAQSFNERVSIFAKNSSKVGLIGAAAAWGAKFVTSNVTVSSLAKHALSPLLGLGVVGSVLWVFTQLQSKQLPKNI